MEKEIVIPLSLFERLQKHAVPFEDTPATVIERMLDFFEEHNSSRGNGTTAAAENDQLPPVAVPGEVREFDPRRPPDLTHTRVRGQFAGTSFSQWTDLLRISHIEAYRAAGSFEALREITRARIRNGSHSDSGFKPIPEIGLSIQGVDANHAWSRALRLAEYLRVPLKALVEWRVSDNAAFPGETGLLAWSPHATQPQDEAEAVDPWTI
jgi:hypothetical protein